MERKKEDLKIMADALEELQLNLEPIRDKALDQRAFYTGYAQCAEQMIKVIVARMEGLRSQAEEEIKPEVKEEIKSEMKEEVKLEAPLIIDEEKPKKKRKKKED